MEWGFYACGNGYFEQRCFCDWGNNDLGLHVMKSVGIHKDFLVQFKSWMQQLLFWCSDACACVVAVHCLSHLVRSAWLGRVHNRGITHTVAVSWHHFEQLIFFSTMPTLFCIADHDGFSPYSCTYSQLFLNCYQLWIEWVGCQTKWCFCLTGFLLYKKQHICMLLCDFQS